MNILRLTLKRQWFNLIESGKKTEEYRDIKPYWITRLMNDFTAYNDDARTYLYQPKEFDQVTFVHGYSKDARRMTFELKGISVGPGLMKWGADPRVKYFVIKLGERIA